MSITRGLARRILARYWFIVPIFILIVGLQLGAGFMVFKSIGLGLQIIGPAGQQNDAPPSLPPFSLSLPGRPTSTPAKTPAPLGSATFTPSPTRTPTPLHTPTGTLTPSKTPTPSATPTNTLTPTPEPTPLGQGFTLQVPILMYHYLSAPPADADVYRLDLSVTPEQFESHLAYLRQAGYETITMQQLAYALSRQTPLPPQPIIITFDDGYRDNYENAFPLLRKYGYTGVFFIFTYPLDFADPHYLTWDMVAEMHRAGMEFGSHSYRHYDMRGQDVDFLVYEILASKEAIEAHTGEPVRFFSYPAGSYDDLTIRVLDSAHFWNAVTTEWGIEHAFANRFELPRLRVRGTDTAADLAHKLNSF
ncbi:MAG: polysaccharide deacetylase family protein [Anaerolineae bacterium]|nr:polysaccharide deacetylase family protein [Anaerolineae bacterium]